MFFSKLNIAYMILLFVSHNLLSMDPTINLTMDMCRTISINNTHTTEILSLEYKKCPSYISYTAYLANQAHIHAVQNISGKTIFATYWNPSKNSENNVSYQEGYLINEDTFHILEKVRQEFEQKQASEDKENKMLWLYALSLFEESLPTKDQSTA
jgi:hypothetical protein